MTDFPEKPKRTDEPPRRTFSRTTRLLAFFTAAAVGLPMSVAVLSQRSSDMLLDMFLLGVMICCGFYLTYQGVRWLIRQQMPDDTTLDL